MPPSPRLSARMTSSTYFARYFAFDLPADQFSDVQVETLLASLSSDASRAVVAARELRTLVERDPVEMIRIIARRWALVAAPSAVFAFLESLEPLTRGDGDAGLSGGPGSMELRLAAVETLRKFDRSQLDALAARIADDLPTRSLMTQILSQDQQRYGSEEFIAWFDAQRQTLIDTLAHRVEGHESLQPGSEERLDADLLYRLAGPRYLEIARDKLRAQTWTPRETLSIAMRLSLDTSVRGYRIAVRADVIADDELVDLLQHGDPGTYPATWHVEADVEEAINFTPRPPVDEIASYVLANWPGLQRPVI